MKRTPRRRNKLGSIRFLLIVAWCVNQVAPGSLMAGGAAPSDLMESASPTPTPAVADVKPLETPTPEPSPVVESSPAATPTVSEASPIPSVTSAPTPLDSPAPVAVPEVPLTPPEPSPQVSDVTPSTTVATPLVPETVKTPVMSQTAIDVIKELTKIESTPDRISGALWLPPEYFQLALKDNPNISGPTLEKILKSFGNYTVLGVLDARRNADGSRTYASTSKLFNETTLVGLDGSLIIPLDETEVDVAITRLLSLMKPKLREMAGVFGENMAFLVFPGKNEQGKRIADPLTEGKLEVRSSGKSTIWRLPLASMVASKNCPVCNERFPGAYHYCPYDGTALH